jgi:hypothetical protein
MHRWLIGLSSALVTVASVVALDTAVAVPRARAAAPVGHLGDTLRVDTGAYIADVTVTDVSPCDPPPGFGFTRAGNPVKSFPGSMVNRADVTVHAIKVPDPATLATTFSFDGLSSFADAYLPRASDAPDALDKVLSNAPNGATVHGSVYWDVYRDPVSHVVLMDKRTAEHLAQWNF